MTLNSVGRHVVRWTLPISLLIGIGACTSSDSTPSVSIGAQGREGDTCQTYTDCTSGVCSIGRCVGNGIGKASSQSCSSSTECASGTCANGSCTAGQNMASGYSCTSAAECLGRVCLNGACSTTDSNGQGGSSSAASGASNPPFQGMGVGWRPLVTGCGPDTALLCGGTCEQKHDANANAKVLRAPATFCFGADATKGVADPTSDDPAAMIEQVIETLNGTSYVHIRVTFDPAFVDNTYGANASKGWYASGNGKTGKGHTFTSDLTGSDHLELLLTDASGATVMSFGEDYISSLSGNGGPKPEPGKPAPPGAGGAPTTSIGTSSTSAVCGYTNLGALGGDGKMMVGNASDILATSTSLDRNLNGCGYCRSDACSAAGAAGASGNGDCTVNSPFTDDVYTPNPSTPNWNYSVVYEAWILLSAFASGGGFGQAYITFVHASPSKIPGNNTLYVTPTPCPPSWASCPPGATCPPNGAGGASGVAGAGNVPDCPTNYEVSITLEDVRTCNPIPFAGWPNMSACPAGYALQQNVTDESQHCVSSN